MRPVVKFILFLFLFSELTTMDCFAQQGYEMNLEKPKKFENRSIGYEKTYKKKNTVPRKFIQGTISHYNYFFNADNKLKDVLKAAKRSHEDDFTKLLPFYNYTLTNTAASKSELDSVIYKATAGIVLHDLRNGWIDNLYLLIGKAYFFRNDLDSAAITFQFINYAFAPREKDGYAKVIASNSTEGGNAFLISTKENRSLTDKMFSEPPSRNESLLWMIRTAIEQERMTEAASLMQALRLDPSFPGRLKPELDQLQAYYFYLENVDDSAAYYLEKALPTATSNTELSRWQFLIAQLYENTGRDENAVNWYNKAIKTTLNPVLDVYARLNALRLNKDGGDEYVKKNIEALYKMARRDSYTGYRDIIYYTAGIMDKERLNYDGLIYSMKRSIRFNERNPSIRNKAWQELGNAWFFTGNFVQAKSAYDSIQLEDPSVDSVELLIARKLALTPLVANLAVIQRQDSLQKIAALPEPERTALLEKMVKAGQKRNRRGLVAGEEAFRKEEAAADLFGSKNSGDWYFYNNSLKSKGFTEFQQKWPNRQNVDNWRRITAINRQAAQNQNTAGPEQQAADSLKEISMETLLANLPLTPEKLKISDDSIRAALMEVGQTYQQQLEDYRKAADQYETLLGKYPDAPEKEAAFYNLYYCYWKLGLTDKANRFKNELIRLFPGSPNAIQLKNPDQKTNTPEQLKKEATRKYEGIYRQFIEGDFAGALAQKKSADSTFGSTYWTPQLLYIESVYHIKQRNDSTAISTLDKIINQFPASPLAGKAETMKSVLRRRSEIENYLTNLQIERKEDVAVQVDTSAVQRPDTAVAVVPVPAEKLDSLKAVGIAANNTKDKDKKPVASNLKIDKNVNVQVNVAADSIIQKWKDAEVKDLQAIKTDTIQKTAVVPKVKDSISVKAPVNLQFSKNGFAHDPLAPHMVLLVLDKVDPVYVSEARNAFARYNRENYNSQRIELVPVDLTGTIRFLAFKMFPNAAAAQAYAEVVRKRSPLEIVPWLPADKYSFIIISEKNLTVLENGKDLAPYKDFLQDAMKSR